MTQRALGKMLVGNIIVTAAARAPNKVAFYCAGTGRRFTFRQVNERCNRLANILARLGLAKGDVVAFLCSNRAEMPEIYYALAKCGIVGIPLNYRLAPTEMAETNLSPCDLSLLACSWISPHLASDVTGPLGVIDADRISSSLRWQ